MTERTLENNLLEALGTDKRNIDKSFIIELLHDYNIMERCRHIMNSKHYDLKNFGKTEPDQWGKQINILYDFNEIKKVDDLYLKHRKSFTEGIKDLGLTANQRKDLDYKMQKIKPIEDDGDHTHQTNLDEFKKRFQS